MKRGEFFISEVTYIQNNWQTQTDEQLARHLNRTKRSVKTKRQRLGLMHMDKVTPRSVKKAKKESCGYYVGYEGKNGPYVYVQINKGSQHKTNHRYIKGHVKNWIEKYGKIPPGQLLRCRTKDTLNTDPDNWQLVNKAEHMKLNENTENHRAALKGTWNKVKIMEANGLKPRCGLRSKIKQRPITHTKSLPSINKNTDFNF